MGAVQDPDSEEQVLPLEGYDVAVKDTSKGADVNGGQRCRPEWVRSWQITGGSNRDVVSRVYSMIDVLTEGAGAEWAVV